MKLRGKPKTSTMISANQNDHTVPPNLPSLSNAALPEYRGSVARHYPMLPHDCDGEFHKSVTTSVPPPVFGTFLMTLPLVLRCAGAGEPDCVI